MIDLMPTCRECNDEVTKLVSVKVAGVLPSSYAFEDGRWMILPQIVELPRSGTLALLGVANAAMIIVPSMFIAQLRQNLSNLQARQLTQAWQFKQLAARV